MAPARPPRTLAIVSASRPKLAPSIRHRFTSPRASCRIAVATGSTSRLVGLIDRSLSQPHLGVCLWRDSSFLPSDRQTQALPQHRVIGDAARCSTLRSLDRRRLGQEAINFAVPRADVPVVPALHRCAQGIANRRADQTAIDTIVKIEGPPAASHGRPLQRWQAARLRFTNATGRWLASAPSARCTSSAAVATGDPQRHQAPRAPWHTAVAHPRRRHR